MYLLAGIARIELALTGSKPDVLPLYYIPFDKHIITTIFRIVNNYLLKIFSYKSIIFFLINQILSKTIKN